MENSIELKVVSILFIGGYGLALECSMPIDWDMEVSILFIGGYGLAYYDWYAHNDTIWFQSYLLVDTV